ncbi:MAG: bifunctional demethylmenaquinone methyltransferase/2-methoxy-6-polyprenyl-1,4-benzoquinol methylase UbiE [Bacteroidia bacterium]|jgi:demethylmenaquinone methyltransferase/2-methoxy-6-polyprenyl-1,4-benzoquinol methylase|nr:bifunctional demethylmenaquinone methyltransferase/2-methoxy-6-polyprenyl-1,4-benzoquinol methylase UbiE [Bacteroidia bacterium]MCC6768898.1 bifunctional demethylmenaquinone methyltransferase/2-methoxy-6-polyprenyl-1,4-benzoquinol methylase UbiE [Bacteroidia bacterium]
MSKVVTPYAGSDSGKKEQVEQMFDDVAHRYDFLNRFLSVGIDIWWRKKMVAALKRCNPQQILDIATGTADVAIALRKLGPQKITGIDLSEGMLAIGRKKVQQKGLSHLIELKKADSENLPFTDRQFDAVTVAFGVRNFENLQAGLQEMNRVLSEGGKVVILEFSRPHVFPVKQLYDIYFRYFCPFIGKLFSKNVSAYQYLYDSVQAFPDGASFEKQMQDAGFKETKSSRLTFGIVTLYTGNK